MMLQDTEGRKKQTKAILLQQTKTAAKQMRNKWREKKRKQE